MENRLRTSKYVRDPKTETVLGELTSLLENVGCEKVFKSDWPVIFVVGCARSGTTLLTQYLAAATHMCYPTNFISRFYFNPYIGALLQYLMFDLDYKEELFGRLKNLQSEFLSELGKTKGAMAPNEFWYYWRRFFKFSELQKLEDHVIANIDQAGFVNGIKAIQYVFGKPIFMKGMILNWDIPFLYKIVPNSYFVFVERDLAHNAYSLLQARRTFFNDVNQWYSFKPIEYDEIKKKISHHQVVDQVHYTNKAIEVGLAALPYVRFMKIRYEDFCKDPMDFALELMVKCRLDKSLLRKDFNTLIKSTNVEEHYSKSDWNEIIQYASRYR